MAKRNQFWEFIYLAERTDNKFKFLGDNGESRKDAMRRLYATHATNGRKINILDTQLVESNP